MRLDCFTAFGSLLLVTSCSRVERARECSALHSTVNESVTQIAALHVARKTDAKAYHEIARRYETLAKRLRPLAMRDPRARQDVAEYASLFTKAAQAARLAASGLEKKDVFLLRRAERELERLNLSEKQIVRKLNAWCQKA